jgi:hypothetical protein
MQRKSRVGIFTDFHISTPAVFPDTLVRLCQFHIIQAIQRWVVDRGDGDKLSDPDNPDSGPAMKIRLSKRAKADLLQEFRLTQRCRDMPDDRWEDALEKFERAVDQLCSNHGISDVAPAIIEYFRRNWWCDTWRGVSIFTI